MLISISFVALACQPKASTTVAVDPFQYIGHKVRLSGVQAKTISVLVDDACLRQMRAAKINSRLLESIPTNKIQLSVRKSPIQSHRIEVSPQTTQLQIKEWANEDPCVIGVADNQKATTQAYGSDPLYSKQSHLYNIHSAEAHDFFFDRPTGIKKDVIIAFIDSGIDLQHQDLRSQLWVNNDELNGDPGIDDDKNGFIDDVYGYNFVSDIGDPSHQTINDHGTHLTGLAAAAINNIGGAGVIGQKVKIMTLNVFGKNWETETVYIDQAIRYAADNGANVINISIGGRGPSETTASAIVYALKKGCVITVAAGNTKQDIGEDFYFPASYAPQYSGLISVAAVDASLNTPCAFTNFSSSAVKIAAPGCDAAAIKSGLLSTRLGDKYGYKSGTSQASAIVAGAAALVYGVMRDSSGAMVQPAEVERILTNGSDSRSALFRYVSGGRKLNLMGLTHKHLLAN
ncbi:MAG: hypothetical protein A2Z20_09040 [Bdellovibrionales bacterium RBG_16_40_8]|nr:MAG: hypothetical protein A2Z20_09040 [Bdellovibrionales bacterium RBG_16_40_8]